MGKNILTNIKGNLSKFYTYILLSLFFILPIIHSNLPEVFGIKGGFQVDGNYEFTKVMVFNILSGISIGIYLLSQIKIKKEIIIPKMIFYIIGVLVISNIFSATPLTSLFGNHSKGHSTIMFFNLIGIFVILINSKKNILKKMFSITITSVLGVAILGVKEYYLPSFDYGDLSNRALSSLGHPNHLALLILIVIPLVQNKKIILSQIYQSLILCILLFILILTKSIWGILICGVYLGYKAISPLTIKIKRLLIYTGIIIGASGIWYLLYSFGYITKIHSFLSRFFIWETTIRIIFSDIKIFLFGGGLETLEFSFDTFKSPYLYIFENFGFTADRPHNLFLNIWYDSGILGIILFCYISYNFIKTYQNTPYTQSIIIFFVFTFFNFASITHYLIITLISSMIYKEMYPKRSLRINRKGVANRLWKGVLIIPLILSILLSVNYYKDELTIYQYGDGVEISIWSKGIKKESYEQKNLTQSCTNTIKYSSVENSFYCGNILREQNQGLAKHYYQKGLKKLPDLWNKDSQYWSHFLIKYFVDGKRFFSPKYSNIQEILERVGQ